MGLSSKVVFNSIKTRCVLKFHSSSWCHLSYSFVSVQQVFASKSTLNFEMGDILFLGGGRRSLNAVDLFFQH